MLKMFTFKYYSPQVSGKPVVYDQAWVFFRGGSHVVDADAALSRPPDQGAAPFGEAFPTIY
jgi:hypothetical protein